MDTFDFLHQYAQINPYLPYQQFSRVFEGGEGMKAMKPIRRRKRFHNLQILRTYNTKQVLLIFRLINLAYS